MHTRGENGGKPILTLEFSMKSVQASIGMNNPHSAQRGGVRQSVRIDNSKTTPIPIGTL